MKGLLNFLRKIEPDKTKSPVMHAVFDGFFTFLYAPDETTHDGAHVRDGMDLKRLMVFVVLALIPCYIFGMYNIGHQHFNALGLYPDFGDGGNLKFTYGLIQILPILVVSMAVGLGIEFFFAAKKGHGIEEGFLVSGMLIPLIMPPDIPMWILTLAIIFAVVIGKEAFGGTGMNILNVALLARVFVFFAYPMSIAGDDVWISGFETIKAGTETSYGWAHGLFNGLFEAFGWATFEPKTVIDGITGATPLALAAKGGWSAVTEVYSPSQMFWGEIPGSIGETVKPAIILGALFLLVTRVASWRIMFSMIIGMAVMGLLMNAWGATDFMQVPWYAHFYMGSFLFAMAFMATDPVTAATTRTGKWIYGFLIGVIGMIVRVWNPAYPEGWMLAILFLNVFAPLIDHYVIEANMKRRLKRVNS